MKKIGLRKALEIVFGATNIKLKRAKNDYIKEFSGFFDDSNGNCYYINANSAPYTGLSRIMYRTARNRKDFQGGNNTWNFEILLRAKGYLLNF